MANEGEKKQTSPDKKDASRRKLLKTVVASGGVATVAKLLPDQWVRPVVDSVLLPSHATTSDVAIGPFTASGPFAMNDPEVRMAEQGFSEELLEFFAPSAHAGVGLGLTGMTFSSNSTGDSFLCADYNATTQVIAVQAQNNSFTSTECLHGYHVAGGHFVDNEDNTGWVVSFVNVTTEVLLIKGGDGCSLNHDYGRCLFD